MIPFKDDNPTTTIPLVVIVLIIFNAAILFYQASLPHDLQLHLVASYALIPAEITGPSASLRTSQAPIDLPEARIPWLTLFTSMFLHGGFFHLFSNMLYLWIFGNNIEDLLGHVKFLIFYLLCGLAAAFAHILTNFHSAIPTLGASGAIAGTLGAYLIKYPKARVYCLLILFPFIRVVRLPASLVLIFWFVLQLWQGAGSVVPAISQGGGVAWFAHIGGFLAGMALINWLGPRRPRRIVVRRPRR